MEIIHDRTELLAYFQEDIFLHIYSIGDLSPRFWKHTIWYGLRERGRLTAVVLLYTGLTTPTLLALTNTKEPMLTLAEAVIPLLPNRFEAHVSLGIEQPFKQSFTLAAYEPHLKMGLKNGQHLDTIDTTATFLLTPADAEEVGQFYNESYPGNWFEPHMLDIGYYFGLRQGQELVSVAGVHVYSSEYKVAALGGITTHPNYRGRGFAQKTVARLCQELRKTVDYVGLNVVASNETAVAVYQKLGFVITNQYSECTMHAIK